MHDRRPVYLLGMTLLLSACQAAQSADADPLLRVLIVDGQNNHAWQTTTPHLQTLLESSGRFVVTVATAPPSPTSTEGARRYQNNPAQYQADMDAFCPAFGDFDVVLSNYNGVRWSPAACRALEDACGRGTGLVIVHAANNAFADWPAYNELIGLGWRSNAEGWRLTLDSQGRPLRVPPGQGPSAGHGKRHTFQVVVRDADHPITRGMPQRWLHVRDELYHGLRGPAQHLTLLATAFDAVEHGGTGADEPVMWTVTRGKGRVFHLPLGHDLDAMSCTGFATCLLRGTEWAATGTVTIPLPKNFPTEDQVASMRPSLLWRMLARYGPVCVPMLMAGVLALRLMRRRRLVLATKDAQRTSLL